MKSFPVVLIAVCCGLVSCEKAKEMVGRLTKKPTAEVPATADSTVKDPPEHTAAAEEVKPETPQPGPQTMSKDWLPPGMQRR